MSHKNPVSIEKIAKKLWFQTNTLAVREFLGVWKSRFTWNGISFAESRPWQSWDPKNRIDRKTTAKKSTVYVKEFEEERQLRFMCFADAWYAMYPKSETVIDITSLFCHAALDLWDQFWWGVFDADVSWLLKPSHSLHTLERWKHTYTQMLAESTPSQRSSLSWLLNYLYAVNLKDSICIIVCDEMLEEELPLLSRLARHNDCIILHLFTDFELTLSQPEWNHLLVWGHWWLWLPNRAYPLILSQNKRRAYRERFEEKRAQTKQYIHKAWADYVMINQNKPVWKQLMEFFTRRKARR